MRTVLATIAVATYEPPDVDLAPADAKAFEALPGAAKSLAELAAFLRTRGFEEVVALPANGGARYAAARRALQALNKRLRDLAKEGPVDVVLIWSGHGEIVDGELRLATADSWSPLDGASGQSPAELARALPMEVVRQAVVVIESCHAGGGVLEIGEAVGRALDRRRFPEAAPNLVVMASSQRAEKSLEGRFTTTMLQVLREGPSPAARNALAELGGGQWSPHNKLLTPSEVLRAVAAEFDTSPPVFGRQRPRLMLVDLDRPVFPNPSAVAEAPDLLVENALRRAMRADDAESHFLPKARGLEPGEEKWRFTGRLAANRELVAWLARRTPGLAIVTGSAGAGKSALLGRLAALSDPEYRAEATAEGWDEAADTVAGTVPPLDCIDAAVHARGRTRDQLAAEIGTLLGLASPPAGWSAVALITSQSLALGPPVILVDALDESAEPEPIGREFLRALVQGGWRVLVGTRPGSDPSNGRGDVLLEALGPAVLTIDLDDQPDTTADLVDYVTAQLRGRAGEIQRLARKVAESANGSFLYARLVASSLRRSKAGRASDPLSATVADAFWRELDRLALDSGTPIDTLTAALSALAWAEGRGIPLRDDVWPRIASAMSMLPSPCTREDIEKALHAARSFVIESGEDGQAVYRLFHQELVEALRDRDMRPAAEQAVQQAIVAALRPRRDWFDANPYVLRYLVVHAAKAGTLPALLAGDRGIDLDLLAVTDPSSLRRAAGEVVSRLPLPIPESGNPDDTVLVDARWLDAVDAVTSAEHVLVHLDDPRDRVAAIELTLSRSGRQLTTRTRHRADWRWLWSTGGGLSFRTSAQVPARQRWVGIWTEQWGYQAVASGPRGLQAIPRGAWTAPSTIAVADRPIGLAPDGHAAAADVTGRHPTSTGRTLRFKMPLAAVVDSGVLSLVYGVGSQPEELGPVPGICRSVSIGEIAGRTVVVTAADEVTVWWTDSQRATPLGGPGWATHVVPGSNQVATAGMDQTIRLWNPVDGSRAELPTVLPFVTGLASARIGGRRMLAACGSSGIELFDLDTGTSDRWLSDRFVLGVDLAEVGGRGVLAAGFGQGSGLVRVWHLNDKRRSVAIDGHDGGVWAVRIVGEAGSAGGADLVSVDEAGTLACTNLSQLETILHRGPTAPPPGIGPLTNEEPEPIGIAPETDVRDADPDVVAVATGRVGPEEWKATMGDDGFLTLAPVAPTVGRTYRSRRPIFPLPRALSVFEEGRVPHVLLLGFDGGALIWKPPLSSKPHEVLAPFGRGPIGPGADPFVNRIVAHEGHTMVVSARGRRVRLWDRAGGAIHEVRSPIGPILAVTAGFLDDELVLVVGDRISVRVMGLDGVLRRDPIPIGGKPGTLDLTQEGLLRIETESAVHALDLHN